MKSDNILFFIFIIIIDFPCQYILIIYQSKNNFIIDLFYFIHVPFVWKSKPLWGNKPRLKSSYDAVIIGGGLHGLATAYYLAKEHGMTDVADY
jgi:hypothetical protein